MHFWLNWQVLMLLALWTITRFSCSICLIHLGRGKSFSAVPEMISSTADFNPKLWNTLTTSHILQTVLCGCTHIGNASALVRMCKWDIPERWLDVVIYYTYNEWRGADNSQREKLIGWVQIRVQARQTQLICLDSEENQK